MNMSQVEEARNDTPMTGDGQGVGDPDFACLVESKYQ
jgi:hypothetical protein